jgi:predicted nuclease of predicted toxin-antitoxin system
VKILLDENFPLPLYHRLREKGYDAEHVIALGQRGMPDSALRQRLASEELYS